MCYYCKACDAFVGCHNNTRKPLGTMANKELRNARMRAHAAFDPLWRDGSMSRHEAYQSLTKYLKLKRQVHIGESDLAMCDKIVEACQYLETIN